MASTHFSQLKSAIKNATSFPIDPYSGQIFYHTGRNILYRYDGTSWRGVRFVSTTSTSSSTSTTTTTTSTTTTSTSSSTTTISTSTTTTTSTSSSTSTSTTTTL